MAEQIFKCFVDKSISILTDDKEDRLLHAIKDGDLNIVTILLSVVSDMHNMKIEGEPLLNIAACNGQHAIVKFLINIKGADFEAVNDDGLAALHVASGNGHLEIVKFLVSKGADINRKTYKGMTPLAYAAEAGCLDVLKFIINRGVDIDISHNKGWTPLIWACARGHLSTVNYLLHFGADPNRADKVYGWTSMHCSIVHDHQDILKSLVNAGADVNWPDEDGTTPLHVACSKGRLQMVKDLLSNGADLQKVELNGTTSLHYATDKGHYNIIKIILQNRKGLELVNWPDTRGITPLHMATSRGFTSIIDLLVCYGGDLNAKTNDGYNCLNYAKAVDEVEVTKELSQLMARGRSDGTLRLAEAFVNYLVMKGAGVNTAGNHPPNPNDSLSNRMAQLFIGVTDAMLNKLSRRIPNTAYNIFSEKLGIDHTVATNILVRVQNDYEKATRECLSMWKVTKARTLDDLHNVLRAAELDGLIQYIN